MTTQQAPIAKFLIVFAAFVIVVSGLKMASSLVGPVFISRYLFAMIVSPLLAWLKQRRVPGSVAILLIISLILAMGLVLAAVVGSSVDSFRQDIPVYSAKLSVISESINRA
jgi:predicted PurR-regulated permease PerM